MTLSILRSADPSPQPQASTPAEGHDESTQKAQPDDATDDDPMVVRGEDTHTEVMEITTSAMISATELNPGDASTEGRAVEENPFGGSENGSVGSTFTPGEFDQSAGSGMLPPHSGEEGAASPTAPVGEPEETQPATDNERQNETTEPDAEDASPERKTNTSKDHT